MNQEPDEDDAATNKEDEMTEEELDETGEESFPASDPPSWTLGTDHGKSESTPESEGQNREQRADRLRDLGFQIWDFGLIVN